MIMPLNQPKIKKLDQIKKDESNKTYSFCEKDGNLLAKSTKLKKSVISDKMSSIYGVAPHPSDVKKLQV